MACPGLAPAVGRRRGTDAPPDVVGLGKDAESNRFIVGARRLNAAVVRAPPASVFGTARRGAKGKDAPLYDSARAGKRAVWGG